MGHVRDGELPLAVWRGVPKPVPLSDPGAGVPATYVPSQGEIEAVEAVTFTLATSATVAARQAVVRFLDGQERIVAACPCPFTLSASKSQVVSLYVGANQFGANDGAFVGGPLYRRWLDGHVTLQIDAVNLKPGDTLTDIVLDVCGYPADWYDDAEG